MAPRLYARATTYFDRKELTRQELFIEDYMRTIDMPDWYRGLSAFQLRAAEALTTALRDDLEQDTTYRVRNILNTIGLQPPQSKKKIRFTMKLSRGNDIAFLWFLKDMYYKSDKTGTYNLNEQLIFTCIAHLDLLFTIRGLDNILPPEQKPKKDGTDRPTNPFHYIDKQLKTRQQHRSRSARHKRKLSISTIKKVYKLPYLSRLRKPRPYGKSLTAQPPEYILKLKFLDDYKDPNYKIPNAANRWFADYQINYARHTANSIINENLDDMFQMDIAKVPNEVFEAQLFKNLKLPKKPEIDPQVFDKKQLCVHHQILEELEQNLEHELRVIARDKCLKYLDVETPRKEERIARLRKQIENDVNIHMKRFKELTKKSESTLLLWSKDNLEKCSKCSLNSELRYKRSNLYGVKENKSNMTSQYRYVVTDYGIELQREERKVKRKPLRERSVNINCARNCNQNRKIPSETEIIGDCLKNTNRWKSSKEQILIIPSNEKFHIPHHHGTCSCTTHDSSFNSSREHIRNYNYGHSETGSDCSGSQYFNAPNQHQPYKFDYTKIFNIKSPYDPRNLRKMCVKAIERDDEVEEHSKKCKSKENLSAAINDYANRTFNANVQKYNEANDEALAEMKIKTANSETKYYDPNDKELMHSMLKDGLQILRKDARYVLPTLPDAHKLPLLRYWIYQRYGKVYSINDLVRIFKKTLALFRVLNKLHIREKLPTAELIGRAVYTDYSCHNYMMKKTDHIREMFYRKMNKSIMEQTRRIFMVMSPYLCTGRPQNSTIFAYLPARPGDIHHFHVWSPQTTQRKFKPIKSSL